MKSVKSKKSGLKGTSFADGEDALKPAPEPAPTLKPKKQKPVPEERELEPKVHGDPPPGDTGPTGGPDGE
ncbi:MAG TPA: hypothetical protein PK095_24590, partial [Myxococcota bacterium]|nr:hypothetical protein [Myxococcota bacterium]